MGLVGGGTAAVEKIKKIQLVLSGWTNTGTGTSVYGSGDINSTDVEYTALGLPDTDENEVVEFETNKRKIKESIENNGFADLSKISVLNDADGVNWRAFVSAKQVGAIGTITYISGTSTLASFEAKVTNVEGIDGSAADLGTAFTPTFTITRAIS